MNNPIFPIIESFRLDGVPVFYDAYGCGHINRTFLCVTSTGQRYILQKINDSIFTDIDGLMSNIAAVCAHLSRKTSDKRRVLQLVKTKSGENYFKHNGEYWRVFSFVEGSVCLQQPETEADFFESAVAFGTFQQQLLDFPADTLCETIPHFHDTRDRYRIFREVLQKDPLRRAADVKAEIDFALAREKEATVLVELLEQGKLPLRVTHNDTKLNNVMLDSGTRKALCVIDLDTVMPGLSLYDFGDSIRFGASSGAEDEKDLSKIYCRMDMFESYARGFIGSCPGLTPLEKEMLPMGAKIMTLECGVRFLTDYLNGDKYFAVHREGHNLDRCRTQFKLVADMESKWQQMNDIIKEL